MKEADFHQMAEIVQKNNLACNMLYAVQSNLTEYWDRQQFVCSF
jgi:hypothetical protein